MIIVNKDKSSVVQNVIGGVCEREKGRGRFVNKPVHNSY